MSDGQHVGTVSDGIVEDDARSAARAQQEALKRLARPAGRRSGIETGDGDRCPITPEHGRMLTVRGSQRQQCPHQEHDGRPKSHPAGAAEQTRSIWPLGDQALAAAVAVYTAEGN